jgi:hypothetical protein
MACDSRYSYLSPWRLGLAAGIVNGVFMFLLTLAVMYYNYGTDTARMAGDLYPGYDTTWPGSLMALIWGFIGGFITFFLIAALYNLFGGCSKRDIRDIRDVNDINHPNPR